MGKSFRKRGPPNFVAIDFETANDEPETACAVGLVRVEKGRIVSRQHYYIRPPYCNFFFSYLHGISWKDVKTKPSFAGLWPSLRKALSGVEFLAAHNAHFDQAVLSACCQTAKIEPPDLPFLCTIQLARRAWNIYPTNLLNVCRHLGFELNHHEALSDAEACARIVLAAYKKNGLGSWMHRRLNRFYRRSCQKQTIVADTYTDAVTVNARIVIKSRLRPERKYQKQ